MKNITFSRHIRIYLLIPAIIILAAVIMSLLGYGINPGIDFTGGSLLEYSVGESFQTEEVSELLSVYGYHDSQVTKAAAENAQNELTNLQIRLPLKDYTGEMIKVMEGFEKENRLTFVSNTALTLKHLADSGLDTTFAGGHEFVFSENSDTDLLSSAIENALSGAQIPVLKLNVSASEEGQTIIRILLDDPSASVRDFLEREMTKKYPDFTYVSIEHAGAVSSSDLTNNALRAIVLALVLMLIYIALRFDLYSGIAALFGLVHDVLIMFSFMVFFRSVYQINSSFIAALLTIVGYSINDTIIIFDRIRENKRAYKDTHSNTEIVNMSVSASFSRTVNTSITTLFTLAALYILGVDSIKEFTFPLLIGMIAGTYSSLILNGPVWAYMMDKSEKRRERKAAVLEE